MYAQLSFRTNLMSEWKDSTDLNLGYTDVWGYVAPSGDEYAIIGSRTKINFINITDPAQPYSVTKFPGGNTVGWRDMKTYKHYAYSICDGCTEGMHIFDLSTLPLAATHVNQVTADFERAHNIFIEGDRLYVVGMIGNDDLLIYDLLADPVNPTLLATIDMDIILGTGADNFYIHDIFVRDNIAYASHGYTGYYIWDVADPQNVTLIADNDFGGYNHSSWISKNGDFAYVAEEIQKGLPIQLVDLTDMTNGNISSSSTFIDNIAPVGPNNLNVTHHNPFVKDDFLYISNYEDGLKIYDIKTPDKPVLFAYYDTYPDDNLAGQYSGYQGAWGTYPFLPSGNILVSDRTYGLQIIELDYKECDGVAKVIGHITTSEEESYSCCIITSSTSSISGNVTSEYTANQYITLGTNFEVTQGSNVLFDIEECVN
jgi:choice-of-anchor B domain-containing protein